MMNCGSFSDEDRLGHLKMTQSQPPLFRGVFLSDCGSWLQGFSSIQPQEHDWGWTMRCSSHTKDTGLGWEHWGVVEKKNNQELYFYLGPTSVFLVSVFLQHSMNSIDLSYEATNMSAAESLSQCVKGQTLDSTACNSLSTSKIAMVLKGNCGIFKPEPCIYMFCCVNYSRNPSSRSSQLAVKTPLQCNPVGRWRWKERGLKFTERNCQQRFISEVMAEVFNWFGQSKSEGTIITAHLLRDFSLNETKHPSVLIPLMWAVQVWQSPSLRRKFDSQCYCK